jgi:ABC-type branched-subunit amino acid transport system substrate-binding protein
VGALTSREAPAGLERGVLAAARELGAEVVYQAHYAAGQSSFRNEVRDLGAKRLDLLFWDGEPAEAEALLRQLGRDRVTVQVIGGSALAPGQFHAEGRFLLEGVRYVGDDWALPSEERARLDAHVTALGGRATSALHVRGYLAGRMIANAVRGGALCPEEVARRLDALRKPHPMLGPRGFVDPGVAGLELPVYAVRRGVAVTEPVSGEPR